MFYRILGRRPELMLINEKKKRTCHQRDFGVPTHHKVKMKLIENIDKYLNPVRELKRLVLLESDGDISSF